MLATSNFAEVGRSYKNIVRVSLGFQRFNFGIWVKATVLEPIVQLAESAVEQADHYVKTGKADKLEKQTYDCILVTGENSKSYNGFHLTSGSQ